MQKDFFKVTDLHQVLALAGGFSPKDLETVPIKAALGRVLGRAVKPGEDMPGFARATMDGYAVRAASTFGASGGAPACLTIKGTVVMGRNPDFDIRPGQAARIATGGMLPPGADSVVMIEHTDTLDELTIEVMKSVAPGQHVIAADEDFAAGEVALPSGSDIRSQELGLLAALGVDPVSVYQRPQIAIISTGDEVVSIDQRPEPGQIRDINTYSLSAQVTAAGGCPRVYGIIPDQPEALFKTCREALAQSDMVLISGGSSVGMRDFTIDVLSRLEGAEILVHGIPISPGKPTILARAGQKALWGLPGHVVSAMVVFDVVVRPFVDHLAGRRPESTRRFALTARLTRNIASAQGRTDFIRVSLTEEDGELWASPLLGKSGLINTMVRADGLIRVGENTEGLEKGARVQVTLL